MSSSSLLKDITVTRCQHTNLFKSNSSLRVVDDKYSFTRARNILASRITSIDSLDPQSYWYNLSDNGAGNFCALLRLEKYLCLSILKTCGLIRQKKVNEKMTVSVVMDQWISFISQYKLSKVEIIKYKFSVVTNNKKSRSDMIFIRIGIWSNSSYNKATTQFNHHIIPPITKMRILSHYFLNSISTDILETIYWSEDESVSDPVICNNLSSNCSKSSYTSHDNPPIF